VVVEFRGRIDLDPTESDSRLYDGRLEDGDPDGDQRLRLQQHEQDGNSRGGAHGLVHVQPGVACGGPVGSVHGHVDGDADLVVVELQ
jgi:hypothetical protein